MIDWKDDLKLEKGVNLQIEEFKNNILQVTNDSKMPISITKLVLYGIYNDVVIFTNKTLEDESKAFQESLQLEKSK